MKAIDEHGTDGNWSAPFSVNIIPASYLDIQVNNGIGICVSIKNIGDATASNGNWNIAIKGGILGFVNLTREGKIKHLGPEEEMNRRMFPIGFGRIEIVVNTEVEGDIYTKEVERYVYFIFVKK